MRSVFLEKNSSWKYFRFRSSIFKIGFFGKIKKNSSKEKSKGICSDKTENFPDENDILFSVSLRGFEINSSAVKINSESFVSKLEKTS